MSERIKVKVKVCGLTTVADALATAEAGADWIGLNFVAGSPRRVDDAIARAIVDALPAGVEAVGLFVDASPEEVRAEAEAAGFGLVQLHGGEPPGFALDLSPALRVVKAFRLGDLAAVDAMLAWLEKAEGLGCPPHAVLVDAYLPGLAGGTGRRIRGDLLDALPPLPRLILAGGLDPGNVAESIGRVGPWMVDVAGGVESSPGRKDPAKVAAFVAATRGARRASGPPRGPG